MVLTAHHPGLEHSVNVLPQFQSFFPTVVVRQDTEAVAISKGPQVEHVKGCKEVVEFCRNLPWLVGKGANWQESFEPLPAFHPWLDQFEATLVHGNIGFPIPENVRRIPTSLLTSGKRHLADQGTWFVPAQCSNPGLD